MERLEEHFWPMDIVEIVKIRTSPRNNSDFIGWFPEARGMFTAKSAYKLATEAHDEAFAGGASSASPNGSRTIRSSIWKTNVPHKMRIMAWRTATGSLATNLAKSKRNIPGVSTCPLCGVEQESSFHALIACRHARCVWEGVRKVWPLPDDSMLVDT